MQLLFWTLAAVCLLAFWSALTLLQIPVLLVPVIVLILGLVIGLIWPKIGWRKGLVAVLISVLLDALLSGFMIQSFQTVVDTLKLHLFEPINALIVYLEGEEPLLQAENVISIFAAFYSPLLLPLGMYLSKKIKLPISLTSNEKNSSNGEEEEE